MNTENLDLTYGKWFEKRDQKSLINQDTSFASQYLSTGVNSSNLFDGYINPTKKDSNFFWSQGKENKGITTPPHWSLMGSSVQKLSLGEGIFKTKKFPQKGEESMTNEEGSKVYSFPKGLNLALPTIKSTVSLVETPKYVIKVLEKDSRNYEFPLVSPSSIAKLLPQGLDQRPIDNDEQYSDMQTEKSASSHQTVSTAAYRSGDSPMAFKNQKEHLNPSISSGFANELDECSLTRSTGSELDQLMSEEPAFEVINDVASMDGETNCLPTNSKLIVIDCRYHYEYIGGHIDGSINISSPLVMKRLFTDLRAYMFDQGFVNKLLELEGEDITLQHLDRIEFEYRITRDQSPIHIEGRIKESKEGFDPDSTSDRSISERKSVVPVVVFHCEFSSQRGPNMWRLVRRLDRDINGSLYPRLDFPQLFVMKGGYEQFVKESGSNCKPNHQYTTMLNEKWRSELKKEESRKNSEWILAKK